MGEVGRPSKYSPAYCNEVIEHMAEGASLTSFAGEIGVSRDTISEWMNTHPEFSVAAKVGKAKCAAWWEKAGRNIASGGGGPGASTVAIFGMKNMGAADWADTSQVDHRSADGSMSPTKIIIEAAAKPSPE